MTLGVNTGARSGILTRGVGKHKERLTSFELTVGTPASPRKPWREFLLPPHCKLISRKEGVKYLYPCERHLPWWQKLSLNRIDAIAFSIGLAVMPADRSD